MNLSLMHPRDLITLIMKRLYGYGMTTTSGGNLSIMDSDGNMWISPGGIDKGTLRPEDIVCVKKDGTILFFDTNKCYKNMIELKRVARTTEWTEKAAKEKAARLKAAEKKE